MTLKTQYQTYLIGAIGMAIAVPLQSLVYSKYLATDIYANFVVISAIISSLSLAIGQFLQQTIIRYCPSGDQSEQRKNLLKTIFCLWSLIASAAFLCGLIFGAASDTYPITHTILLSTWLSAGIGALAFGAVLQVDGSVLRLVVSRSLIPLVTALVVFLAAKVSHVGRLQLISAAAAAQSLSLIIIWFKVYKEFAPGRGTLVALPAVWSYGSKMFVWFLFWSMLGAVDKYVLIVFEKTEDVAAAGLYGLIANGFCGLTITPLTTVLQNRAFRLANTGRSEESIQLMSRAVRVLVTILITIVVLVTSIGAPGLGLILSDSVAVSPELLGLFIAGAILLQVCTYFHKPLEINERMWAMVSSAAITVVVCGSISLASAELFGVCATSFSLCLSCLCYIGIVNTLVRHKGKLKNQPSVKLSLDGIVALPAIILVSVNHAGILSGLTITAAAAVFSIVAAYRIYRESDKIFQ